MKITAHTVKTLLAGCLVVGTCLYAPEAMSGDPLLRMQSDEIFSEIRSDRVWQVGRSKKVRDEEDVLRHLEELNNGDFHDWRLPTKSELGNLFTLFDMKQNGDVKIRLEGYYWLSDEDGTPYAAAWEIGDGCGPSRTYYTGKSGYIRAVRP